MGSTVAVQLRRECSLRRIHIFDRKRTIHISGVQTPMTQVAYLWASHGITAAPCGRTRTCVIHVRAAADGVTSLVRSAAGPRCEAATRRTEGATSHAPERRNHLRPCRQSARKQAERRCGRTAVPEAAVGGN